MLYFSMDLKAKIIFLKLMLTLGTWVFFTACDENSPTQSFQDNTVCKGRYIVPTDTVLSGELPECTHLTSDKEWVLGGDSQYSIFTRVLKDHVLKIDAGTTIKGDQGNLLLIERGGVLLANGTADAPIIFKAKEYDWGGIVIRGNEGHKDEGNCYGLNYTITNDPNDGRSSGLLRHIIVNDAGQKLEYDVPSQAICMTNLSGSTTIDNITINNSAEDGIEIWGGSANLSNIDINNTGTDGFEVNDWNGSVVGMKIAGARYASIKIHHSKDPGSYKNISIDTSASVKQGGIYFKSDSSAHFENVTIHHNAEDIARLDWNYGHINYGALHTLGLFDVENTTFKNLTITGSNSVKVSGDAKDQISKITSL